MKLGIFGGSFNPIHLGHLHIAREFAQRLSLDRVLLVPAGVPPHKPAPDLAPAEDRLAMCRLAAGDDPFFEVSDLEIRRGGKSYTADTLRELSARFPQCRLFLLMGEDMFLTLQQWREPGEICRLADICAAPRSEDSAGGMLRQQEELQRLFAARVHVCPISFLPLSSTQVRRAVQQGKSLSGMTPPTVEQYLQQRGLYPPRGQA